MFGTLRVVLQKIFWLQFVVVTTHLLPQYPDSVKVFATLPAPPAG
jgi:hypothetical protein